jgi:hypothetical protein
MLGQVGSVWVVVVGLAVAFAPLPGLRTLNSVTDARQFLQTLWQVEAAALALSLAIVIFAFQAIYATRLRGSLRQFAEETGLFPIFYVGASSLALDAEVLLGGGHDAPAGWAATWAVIWGGANLVLLALLFVLTLRAVEPAALRQGRVKRARREARDAAEEIILERLAARLAEGECQRIGLGFSPMLAPRPSATAVPLQPRRAGRVVDVRMRRLRHSAATAAFLEMARPVLTTTIGEAVAARSTLMWLEPLLLRQVPRLAHSFRIGRVLRAGLRDSIEQLHEEALEAIRAGAPGRYRDVAHVYREMLLGAEEAWAPYRG